MATLMQKLHGQRFRDRPRNPRVSSPCYNPGMQHRPADPRRVPLAAAIGTAARTVRLGFGWSQRELGERVGSSQSMISRFEAGRLDHLDLAFADAVLAELGISPWFNTRVPGLADRRRQTDRVHALCGGYVGRRLADADWLVRHEVEVGTGRRRGWIDLLAYRPADHALFCPELKTELHDMGEIQRTLAWYESQAWSAARRVGWTPRQLCSALVLVCTDENDRRVADNLTIIRQAFTGSATALAAWLGSPGAQLPSRAVAMVDPRSRRRDWVRLTRSDGRRSTAPYRDYADLAGRLD
jgi:transcriptional regulator with XRE-family HTH domain